MQALIPTVTVLQTLGSVSKVDSLPFTERGEKAISEELPKMDTDLRDAARKFAKAAMQNPYRRIMLR